jgi:bla regulator protein BlaR1
MIPAAFAPVASHLWQSTLFAAVVGLLTLALRRNQARVRYWLWLAASSKFLLAWSWLVSIGHQMEWRGAPANMPPAFTAVTDMISSTIFLTAISDAKPTPDHLPALVIAIWAVWVCGFVVVAAGWARQWLRIRAMVRAASPLSLGLPILVLSTQARLEPGVVGIFRPALLLPEGITDRLTQAQLRAVIAHELCHVRRRDNLAAAMHMLVEALFWFHPVVWWLGTRLMDERERACDEEVLHLGSEPEAYAEGILNVCKSYIESSVPCVSGISGSDLKKRIVRIMTQRLADTLTFRRKLLLATMGMAAIAGPLVFGALALPAGQSPTVPQWQIEAGGKMTFDVTSIKQNKSSDHPYSNFPLSPGAVYSPNGGLFTATNFPLIAYIAFAYNLTNDQLFQLQRLLPQLPKWIATDRFDIQARAQGNPSKDQMRLMIQSLLADRFKLAIHNDIKQGPVYALAPLKPGKTGSQLQSHSDGPCATTPSPASGTVAPTSPTDRVTQFPTVCGGIVPMHASAPGRMRIGARNVTMRMIADFLTGPLTGVDRKVVDRTGFTGAFDFDIEWALDPARAPSDSSFQPDLTGPAFVDALKEQLGLKLESQTGPVDVLVIDRVEEPSPN